MSILIKDIDMPKDGEFVEVLIWSDGHVTKTGDSYLCEDGKYYYKPCDWEYFTAKSVPPHGRLIDADELLELYDDDEWEDYVVPIKVVRQNIKDAPTVIEAEEE